MPCTEEEPPTTFFSDASEPVTLAREVASYDDAPLPRFEDETRVRPEIDPDLLALSAGQGSLDVPYEWLPSLEVEHLDEHEPHGHAPAEPLHAAAHHHDAAPYHGVPADIPHRHTGGAAAYGYADESGPRERAERAFDEGVAEASYAAPPHPESYAYEYGEPHGGDQHPGYAPASYAADAYAAGAQPSGAHPSEAYPSEGYPPEAYPPDAYPPAAHPAGAFPAGPGYAAPRGDTYGAGAIPGTPPLGPTAPPGFVSSGHPPGYPAPYAYADPPPGMPLPYPAQPYPAAPGLHGHAPYPPPVTGAGPGPTALETAALAASGARPNRLPWFIVGAAFGIFAVFFATGAWQGGAKGEGVSAPATAATTAPTAQPTVEPAPSPVPPSAPIVATPSPASTVVSASPAPAPKAATQKAPRKRAASPAPRGNQPVAQRTAPVSLAPKPLPNSGSVHAEDVPESSFSPAAPPPAAPQGGNFGDLSAIGDLLSTGLAP